MGQAESFRRAKSGVLERGSVRPHWGPEREENCGWCGSRFCACRLRTNVPGPFSAVGATLAVALSLPPTRGKVPSEARRMRVLS